MFLSVLAAGTGWSGCQGMKFPLHVAESFRVAWRLRGCQALEQLCLPEAAGRVGASAHFSVSEPRLFKRAPAVLITHSLGALSHSTQHVAVHVWKYTSASGGWKKTVALICQLWWGAGYCQFVIGSMDGRLIFSTSCFKEVFQWWWCLAYLEVDSKRMLLLKHSLYPMS